jgi:hypothetical protein
MEDHAGSEHLTDVIGAEAYSGNDRLDDLFVQLLVGLGELHNDEDGTGLTFDDYVGELDRLFPPRKHANLPAGQGLVEHMVQYSNVVYGEDHALSRDPDLQPVPSLRR